MQILFGAHETIIKINSEKIRIEYIQHFIFTHFIHSKTDIQNEILLPYSQHNMHHRIFLLKWLYSLYARKNGPSPQLKESLLQRYYKTIKIIKPKESRKKSKQQEKESTKKRPKKITIEENSDYMILGVSCHDDLKTIKKQYKKLIKEFHPDRVYSKDAAMVKSYTKKFQSISQAYNNLRKHKR